MVERATDGEMTKFVIKLTPANRAELKALATSLKLRQAETIRKALADLAEREGQPWTVTAFR